MSTPSPSTSTLSGDKELPAGEKIDTDSPPAQDRVPVLKDSASTSPKVEQIPWRYKITAGSMILLFAFGSSLSETTLGPLKSTLVEELGINSEFCVASGEAGPSELTG